MKAQYRGQEREARELQEVTLAMLRELKSGNVPLDLWVRYLEERNRPMVSITAYGEKGEYGRKFDKLQQEFEDAIRSELELSAGEVTP